MIELQGIRKSFGDLEVLKGIDLSVNKREVISIVGPSGAGKTTLLQVLGTLYRPDAGSILFNGTDLSALGKKALARFRNEHIGFISNFTNCFRSSRLWRTCSFRHSLRASQKRKRASGQPSCSTISDFPSVRTISRRSFRAVSNNAWRWRAP